MKPHVFLLALFIKINLNNAYFDQFVLDRFGLEESELDLSNVNISEKCKDGNKTCIFKCCPEGQMFGRFKNCVPSKIVLSNVTVHTKKLLSTNKTFDSTFKVVPELMKDKKFARNSLWWHKNVYLLEDGSLLVMFPNVYYRSKKIDVNRFCVEMKMNGTEVKPVFMVEYSMHQFKPPNTYKQLVMILLTVCLILILVVYAMIPQLRDLKGIMLMIHFTSLVAATIMQISLESDSSVKLRLSSILTMTFFYYFFMVLSVCWTNVIFYRLLMSRDTKDAPVSKKKELIKYNLYAIGLSFFMTIVVATIELSDMTDMPTFVTPQIKERGNFRFQEIESIYYLYIPLLILLGFNWIVCFIKVIEFCKSSRQFAMVSTEEHAKARETFNRPLQFVKLLTLLTILISLECLDTIYPKSYLGICTLWIGPAIMIIFIWNKNLLQLLKQRFNEWGTDASTNTYNLATVFQKK